MIGTMTLVKINAITVPDDSGDELARRFAARAGAVDNQEGFEGFELLKPTDDRSVWLVVTRWRDEESFQAWVNSPAFAHGHRSAAERPAAKRPSALSACTASCGRTRSRAARRARTGPPESRLPMITKISEVAIAATDELHAPSPLAG